MSSSYQSKKSPGEKLKELRESKGIDLKTVHEETKIPLDVLKAIEEGYTVRVISPFYFKGFTKMYAQYLGADAKELQEESRATDAAVNKEESPEKKDNGPLIKETKKKIRFTSDSTNEFINRKTQKQIVQVVGILLIAFIVFRIGGCIIRILPKEDRITNIAKERKKLQDVSQKREKRIFDVKPKKDIKKLVDPKDKKEEPAQKVVPAVEKKEAEKVSDPQPKVEAPKATPVTVEKKEEVKTKPKVEEKIEKVVLVIRSKRHGWLQVKADGKVVFQSTIKEGMTEKWEANKTIEISGKSIHYLDFEVNGKNLGGLSSAHKNSRRVVITKDGLSVKK